MKNMKKNPNKGGLEEMGLLRGKKKPSNTQLRSKKEVWEEGGSQFKKDTKVEEGKGPKGVWSLEKKEKRSK